jgi:hypothetical protein
MNEMTEPEPEKAEVVKPNIVPSEAWLRKHRERMNTAKPVVSGDAKQGERQSGERNGEKPPESQSGKKVKEEAQSGERMQGIGDGWGW